MKLKNSISKMLALPYIRQFLKNASWSLGGTASGKALFLLSFVIVARILNKEEYGKIGILRSTITMFIVFSSLGMGLTAARFVAFYRTADKNKAYQIHKASSQIALFFGLIMAVVILLFSKEISQISFGSTELAKSLQLTVIPLFFGTIASAQSGTLSGLEDFKQIGINNLIYSASQFILILCGAYIRGGDGVLLALGVSAAILVFLNYNSINKHFNSTIKDVKTFTVEIRKIFVQFSLPAMLSTFVALPIIWWGKALLVRTGGFSEMAIFDISEQWYLMVLFIPNSIGGIILPMLSNSISQSSNNNYKNIIKLNLIVNCAIVSVLALIFIIAAPFIMKFYGKSFANYLPLRILLFASILQTVNSILGQVIASKARMWLGFAVNLFWGISFVLSAIIFVRYLNLGSVGLSYAFLISYILHSVLQGYLTSKL